MSFSVVLEGMTIAAFVVLIAGGKQKREAGWGFMATMAALAGFVQAVGMSIVVCTKIYGKGRRDKLICGRYTSKTTMRSSQYLDGTLIRVGTYVL